MTTERKEKQTLNISTKPSDTETKSIEDQILLNRSKRKQKHETKQMKQGRKQRETNEQKEAQTERKTGIAQSLTSRMASTPIN